MGEWQTYALGDVVGAAGGVIRTGPFGSQLHAFEYTDDPAGVPVVMPKDMLNGRIARRSVSRVSEAVAERLRVHRLAAGDLVLARRGDVGRLAFVETDEAGWLCGTGSMRIHAPDHEVLDPQFLRYALSAPAVADWFVGQAVGATMPNLNARIVSGAPISAPRVSTQRRIASVLSAFDELIETNERRIELLEDLARSLYREWFLYFRFPGHVDVELVGSDLGPIPEGWDVRRLKDIVTLDKGLSYKGAHLTEVGQPMANLKCVASTGGFRRGGTKLYSGAFKSKQTVSAGDLVVANTDLTQAGNVIGSPAIVPTRTFREGGLISHHLFAVRPRDDLATVPFLFHTLAQEAFRSFARSRASGTTVLGLRADDALEFRFVAPPARLLSAFNAVAAALYQQTEALLDHNEDLAATRDLLLPRLVTGRLDISDIDLGVLTPLELE